MRFIKENDGTADTRTSEQITENPSAPRRDRPPAWPLFQNIKIYMEIFGIASNS